MNDINGEHWDRQLHVALEQAGKDILSTVKEVSGLVDHAARRISGGVQAVEVFFNNLSVQECIGPAFAVSGQPVEPAKDAMRPHHACWWLCCERFCMSGICRTLSLNSNYVTIPFYVHAVVVNE